MQRKFGVIMCPNSPQLLCFLQMMPLLLIERKERDLLSRQFKPTCLCCVSWACSICVFSISNITGAIRTVVDETAIANYKYFNAAPSPVILN